MKPTAGSVVLLRLLCASLTLAATSAALQLAAAAAPRPSPRNIAIVFGDDVGYGDLGCFGHPTSRTPNLDAMAATGAKLVQY